MSEPGYYDAAMKQWLALVVCVSGWSGVAGVGGCAGSSSTEARAPAVGAGVVVDAGAMKEAVRALSSPLMEGRGLGTEGIDRAGAWIEQRLEDAGLAGGFVNDAGELGYRQTFEVTLDLEAVEQGFSVNGVALKPAEDFVALGVSANGAFEGEAVFVGYGITSAQRRYDSYAGMPEGLLEGRVAVAYRFEPADSEGVSLWTQREGRWTSEARLSRKVRSAAAQGAVGLVLVDPPWAAGSALRPPGATAQRDAGAGGPAGSQAKGLPAVQITREVWSGMLDQAGLDDAVNTAYARLANRGELEPERLPGVVLGAEVELERPVVTTFNVAGVVPGQGGLAEQVVIVGGHYDHLGFGAYASRRDDAALRRDRLHPGADDNASGTAVVVVAAERYAAWAESAAGPRRTVVFAAFSGEEIGLLVRGRCWLSRADPRVWNTCAGRVSGWRRW